MSAMGQLKDFVEELLSPLLHREKEQDARLAALEQRVTALEAAPAPAAKKTAARNVKAPATTAQAASEAPSV